jgi:hypothetical protein
MPTETNVETPAQATAPITPPAPSSNPVFDDSNIKRMAARFREVAPVEPKSKDPEPNPSKMRTENPPATPPAEKKPEAPTIPELDPAQLPRATREHWKRLEQSRDDYRKQAEEHKKAVEAAATALKERDEQLAKFKGLPVDPEIAAKALTEKEALAKEKEELTKLVETLNLERSPRFQNWWKSETEKHLKIASKHVPADKREELTKLLMEPSSTERDAKLDEIIEPLSNTSKRLINGAIEQLESVKLQREEALSQGSEQFKKLQEVEREEQAKVAKAAKARQAELAAKVLSVAKNFDAFNPTDDPAHNEAIKGREAFISAAVRGEIDEETALMLAPAAVQYLHFKETVVPGLKAEIAKRDELIKQLQGASPRAGDGHGGKTAPPVEPGTGNSFAAKVRELTSK